MYGIKDSNMRRYLTDIVFDTIGAAERWAKFYLNDSRFVIVNGRRSCCSACIDQ
jgi:hypothetical protein